MAAKSSFLDKVLGRITRLDREGLQNVVQRLARERSFLETLFNTIEDGVLVVDEDGRILYFNQAVTRFLGLKPDVEGEQTAYLIPEFENDDGAQRVLKDVFAEVFERELFGWHTDETAWPKNRNLALFREWFDIEIHSVVEDLCDFEIVDDEP